SGILEDPVQTKLFCLHLDAERTWNNYRPDTIFDTAPLHDIRRTLKIRQPGVRTGADEYMVDFYGRNRLILPETHIFKGPFDFILILNIGYFSSCCIDRHYHYQV